jgi:hypothetical protein
VPNKDQIISLSIKGEKSVKLSTVGKIEASLLNNLGDWNISFLG